MVRAKHHLAVLKKLDTGMEFMDTPVRKSVLPDQETDLNRKVHEFEEAPAELVCYSCLHCGEGFRR